MAHVWVRRHWWRLMLARWWAVESICCLWAKPMITRWAYECGWCGRVLDLRELAESKPKSMYGQLLVAVRSGRVKIVHVDMAGLMAGITWAGRSTSKEGADAG